MKNRLVNGLTAFVNLTPKRIVQRICGNITPIFMLHRMVNTNPRSQEKELQHIEWCFKYIRKHKYQPITLNQLSKAYVDGQQLPPKSVVFTLDDGFYDQHEIAAPLFNKYELPYTCFVITDFLDGKLWPWDDQISYILSNTKKTVINTGLPDGQPLILDFSQFESVTQMIDYLRGSIKRRPQEHLYAWLTKLYLAAEVDIPSVPPENFRPMSWDQAQQLIQQGHDIAPHTKTHRILSQLSDLDAKDEIEGSFKRVNEKLKGASRTFAYPTGRPQDYSDREIKLLKQVDASSSVITTPNYSRIQDPIFELPRYAMPHERFDFVQYLSFFDEFKRKLLRFRYSD